MINEPLKEFLDEQVNRFNRPDFIEKDPISIPHKFSLKQDIEIAALLAAIFAWGNRTTIIKKSEEFLTMMDWAPYDFVSNHSESDLKVFRTFKHRTFQPTDALYFLDFFSHYYSAHSTLEELFSPYDSMEQGIANFNHAFFDKDYAPARTRKHIPSPAKGSTCKRLNMFLRWMVRRDDRGVDFGLWERISPVNLICPVDVHVGNISRQLGLLKRKQNDWRAAQELTQSLRALDPDDPIKYDFALFGIGVIGGLDMVLNRGA